MNETAQHLSQAQVMDLALAALAARAPWCMMRLGDGEGLAAESIGIAAPDARQNIPWVKHAGFIPPDALKREWLETLRRALAAADVVGLHTRRAERWAASRTVFMQLAPIRALCTADIHLDWLRTGAYDRMFSAAEKVLLVTGHDLVDAARRRYPRLAVVERFHVPLQVRYFPSAATPFFPVEWRKAQCALAAEDWRGYLALVGAGVPGKAFMAVLRNAGAVVLDVGSVFDLWAGYITRGHGKGVGVRNDRWRL